MGHRVLGRVLVTDLQAVGADGGRLQPDLAVAGVRPQEGEVDAAGVGRGRPLAHGLGPVLVVAQAEEAAVVREELRLGVQVDVGPVGHVQAEALEVEQQRQFVADEVGGARRPGLRVGTVERHGPGAVGEERPPFAVGPVVEAVAAPEVVGLPGGDAVLEHVGRHGGVVADGERNELLLAAVTDELQEVATGQPIRRDVEREGGRPRAGHRADAGRDHGRGLDLGREEIRLHDEAAAEALVEAHPVGLHLDGVGGGVDEQGHVVAGHRADLAGEALERVLGLVVVADPIQRARLRVLGDQPGCRRHDDAAGQLRVHDGGAAWAAWRLARAGTRCLGCLLPRRVAPANPAAPSADSCRNWRRSMGRCDGGGTGSEPPSGGRGCTTQSLPLRLLWRPGRGR